MNADILNPPVVAAMGRDLSVTDLVRMAETLTNSGQGASSEALYAAWIERNATHPLLAAMLFNHSVLLADAENLEAARTQLERAIALSPDFMPAYINLGRVHERMGNAGLAVLQWSAALARMSGVNGPAVTYKTTALNQSARALEAANQDEAAEGLLRQSLELDARQHEAVQHLVALRQRQCKWPVIVPSDRVSERTLLTMMSPLSAAAFSDDPLFQLGIAASYNVHDVATPASIMHDWPNVRRGAGPIRVGYLSSDLREHAVGYLMSDVFAAHDRQAVEVFAYYCGPESSDSLHAHFRATADHFVSLNGLDDDAAARRIADDGIHILVDVNGYTREARLGVVARRPAPIVVNWLGFPGSMASPYHHYLVADPWIIPEESEPYYSEKVLRLPCYQPSARVRPVAATPTRASAGLPEDAMVYCCFNGVHKVTHFTLDRWLAVLGRVPGSVLWLLGSNAVADERLRDHAEARGVARERLVFAEKLANPFHLARYPLADLFLDTTPYGAHTTASDALWAGVPVLTFSGRSFASRVCGSLVRTIGVPELVCTTADEFVERAVALGEDRAQLAELRDRVSAGRHSSSLFDTPFLTRHLEGLYAQMVADLDAGALPVPDLANLDACLEVGTRMAHEVVEAQALSDYEDRWRLALAARHAVRPLVPAGRLADFVRG